MNKYGQFQAKDIDDKFMLEAVWYVQNLPSGICYQSNLWEYRPHWAMRWDVERLLPMFPIRVIEAKVDALERRGLMQGCTCGCRGDYELMPDGLKLIGKQ